MATIQVLPAGSDAAGTSAAHEVTLTSQGPVMDAPMVQRDPVSLALARAEARFSAEEWMTLAPGRRSQIFYEELRLLDAMNVAGKRILPPLVGC